METGSSTVRRDATSAEMDALRRAIREERRKAKIVLGAVLVFVIMGIAILWNSIANDVTRLAAIGVLVAAEAAGLVLFSARRSAWEKRARDDWEAEEVEVREGPGAPERRVRFPRTGIDVTGSGR
jgi:hypothetical protein